MNDDSTKRSALDGATLPGEQLLQSAKMVGDEQDALVWRLGYSAWLKRVYEAVSAECGEKEAEDLARSLRMPGPGSGFQDALDAEVRSIETVLEALPRLLARSDASKRL